MENIYDISFKKRKPYSLFTIDPDRQFFSKYTNDNEILNKIKNAQDGLKFKFSEIANNIYNEEIKKEYNINTNEMDKIQNVFPQNFNFCDKLQMICFDINFYFIYEVDNYEFLNDILIKKFQVLNICKSIFYNIENNTSLFYYNGKVSEIKLDDFIIERNMININKITSISEYVNNNKMLCLRTANQFFVVLKL